MREQAEEPESDAREHWSYELVPVHAQPVVNLSVSLKRRFLPRALDRRIDRVLQRYGSVLFVFYLASLALNISVPVLDAPAGRLASLACFLCGLPLALLSLTTLRYDMVRLLYTTYDFWFYATANLAGYLTVAIAFGDLRIGRLILDTLGFQNIVFIDAQLLGVKRLVTSSSIAIVTINVLLACVMLNRIDGVDFSRSVFRYRNQNHSYNVTLADVVGNGIVTMTIFLFKISYRKRTLFRQHRVAAAVHDGHTVVCAIYRCWIQFTPVQPLVSTAEPVELTADPSAPDKSSTSRRQQLNYVKRVDAFDSRRTVLPVTIRSHALFSRRFLVPLYASAVGGVVLNLTTVMLAVQTSSARGISDLYRRANLVCAALALSLTACFTVSCTALNQREVLKSLLTSFDFGFYALQMVTMHVCICVLYSRYLPVVFAAAASMLWAFWLLTLDALTPMMRSKLGFNVRVATAVAVAGLFIHTSILYHILGDWGPLDRTIWEGRILHRHLQVRVIPFLISRVVTLAPWFLRLLWRLTRASNNDALILRAAVTYQNSMYHGPVRGHAPAPKAVPAGTDARPGNTRDGGGDGAGGGGMVSSAPRSADVDALQWSYEFVPSRSLPVLDLSRSIKSRFLPPFLLTRLDAFLARYNKLLFAGYIVGLGFSTSVPLVEASLGRYIALVSALLTLPLGLGSISTLRYEVVLLLVRTYDFWFFLLVNGATNLMIAVMVNDLRMARLLLDWTGFQNVVLIDSQLRGIRQLSILATIGTFTVLMLLVCVMLGRVDGITDFTIMRYHNTFNRYEITAKDIVGNGLITMSILLLKIVYRKRKLFRRRGKQRSPTIECATFRCGVKLTPCTELLLGSQQSTNTITTMNAQPQNALLSTTQSATAIATSADAARSATAVVPTDATPTMSAQPASASRSSPTRRRQPVYVQQMRYVKYYGAFDSRETVVPVRITSKARFSILLLLPLYTCGVGGFLLTFVGSVAPRTADANSATFAMRQVLENGALTYALTVAFTGTFATLYQRGLFISLVTSFDYVFYGVQLMSIHASLCILYEWEVQRCLGVAASWAWIQWVLTLDALTPMMKTKLNFHIRFAIPVVAMFILWHITTLHTILGDSGPADRIIWQGEVWGHHVVVRVVPFYFSRLVTLTLWCCRLVNRLARASNDDAIVLRGSVAYENYLARESKLKSRTQSLVGTPIQSQIRTAPTFPRPTFARVAPQS